MAGELPKPGVEVIQVFRTTTPSVITPTLVPNVTGVAKQVVELNVDDGAGGTVLNPDAFIQMPGGFVSKAAAGGPPAVYGGLDGLDLVVSINNKAPVITTFSDPSALGITPAGVVAQIQEAFTTAGVTGAYPTLVEGEPTIWALYTVGVGKFQTIFIDLATDPAVAAAFEIGVGKTYAGIDSYEQAAIDIPQLSFPDPRGNLSELGIEQDSIRVFLALGSEEGVRESSRDSAFLRNGEVNDAATHTGSVDVTGLTYPGDVTGLTIVASLEGTANATCTFGTPADEDALVAEIEAAITGLTATYDATSGLLTLASNTLGDGSSLVIDAGSTALVVLGLTAGTYTGANIAAVDDGDGDSLTSLLDFVGEDFTAAATAASVVGAAPPTFGSLPGTTLTIADGQVPQTITFTVAVVDMPTLLAEINQVMGIAAGGRLVASDSAGNLLITHSLSGTDSVIKIIGGTAVPLLDPDASPTLVVGTYRGIASLPEPGDELWVDGVYYAEVVEVAPGGVVTRLKIDSNVPVSANAGSDFFIIAKNLPGVAPRPVPELQITLDGGADIKQEQMRDTQGNPVDTAASLYLTYTAVRKDVSPAAENPGLLVFDDTSQLEEALSPINASNPLGLGLYFALVNGAGVQVTGLGVDEISADAPFGTADAFTRAAEYLEGREVYATTPLTHDTTVHQVWKAHAEAMSEPTAKGERVAIVNQPYPTTQLDTLVASGTDGNSTGPGNADFDTGVANLTALVLNAGVSPTGTIPATEGLFLDIGADAKNYSIETIVGTVVTIRTTFGPGENEDGFYSTDPLPTDLIQEAFTVKVRGAALLTPTGQVDNQGIAETIAAIGQTYGSRRLWMVVPDSCGATIDGLETVLEGFYMTAGICGLIGAQPPQQSFTNFPMVGYTQVIGSNDRFSDSQLNIMAGGGAYIVQQTAQATPLTARMALTTNLTSIETRTDSITKVVDFTAKLLRRALRNFIGRFNITQGFLDSLSSVVDGIGGFLIENGILIGFTLNNIVQDEDAPDTVLIDVTLDPPYPCNYIRLTLVI